MPEGKNNSEIKQEREKNVTYLSGMYQHWFLDYASYVILERAVPYVNDGLKPVQRRIMHSMKEMDDGRYNKVANIIGQTMQYHPHGDASIGDALVQLGQKDLLVDAQGNWGNIFTGDGSAAPRYIEARLSKFALEVLFNTKTTKWKLSYDGRKKEPITLPVKFPLLLAQGVEGIAVGLASKILPHNFNELIDASINYLKKEEFEILPDFPTGGAADFSKYNNGLRGGVVKVRAKIEKVDNKTLAITELPYGKTTSSIIDSIIRANQKNKIKIKRIDDNTSENVEILVHLSSGISSDKTIDALYAFTDCEVSISPNSCVIQNDKPRFMGVSEILKINTDQTVSLLKLELEIRKAELLESWHFATLERIFIEERIYKDIEFEQANSMDDAIAHTDKRLEPWKPKLKRDVVRDDILKLMEIRMARILKFNSKKAVRQIKSIESEIRKITSNIKNIIPFTIEYYLTIKDKYGSNRERKTEIRNFENIVASKVIVANEKLYIDREEGFMGTSLKKAEFVCDCSDIDDIIVFRKDGSYFLTKVSQKAFIGKNIQHLDVFKKNDRRTIYNLVYRDGRRGNFYMKRFAITGLTRDKEYKITQGTEHSRIWYFSANPNGEAEVLKVTLKPKPRLKKLYLEVDFSELAIKGRGARGNILTKNAVHRINLKEKGVSTLGGRKIWFDKDVLRLNSDKRGVFLGEFMGDERILVLYETGKYQLFTFDLSNHFGSGILSIEKHVPGKILSVVYYDADQEYHYVKRFEIEIVNGKKIGFIGENEKNKLISVSWAGHPRFELKFGGKNADRENEIINISDFIGVKSYKAKGKRLSIYEIKAVKELEPLVKVEEEKNSDEPAKKNTTIPFEISRPSGNGDPNQMTLFE